MRSEPFGQGQERDVTDEPQPARDYLPMHTAGKREVDLYVRTYNTLLRSSGPVQVETLVPAHLNIESSLHAGAREPQPDMNAFLYSTLRLPAAMVHVERILLGQSAYSFARSGYPDLESWEPVSAPGRRRRWWYDRHATLAAYVASASDLDDMVPTIVAWQIEWNKMHGIAAADERLRALIATAAAAPDAVTAALVQEVHDRLMISAADWDRLAAAWGDRLWPNLALVARDKKRMTIQMLGGTYVGYARTIHRWWTPIERELMERGLIDRPIYFVSSNTHSIANILSGTARRRRDRLVRFVEATRHRELWPELQAMRAGASRSNWDNFLYYTARLYYAAHPGERATRDAEEEERGITTIEPQAGVDVAAQVIELNRLRPEDFDPRLRALGELRPEATDAVMLNINYPLGMAAYHILTRIAMSTYQIKGVYILGKAATLNARIGDVMVPDVVFDEHSGNTYWLRNSFGVEDLTPFLVYGSALDHQRAVTVLGTYLQNRGYLDFFYRGNYTVVEMEAGPYLSALYEDTFLTRHGQGEHVNLAEIPIDLGIIHYASDTPYTRARTLGARGLSYYGMDSTYASTLAIVRRVFEQTGVLRPADAGEPAATAGNR